MDAPDSVQDLLSFDTRAFAVLATVMPDGRPQATPVWFDVEQGDFRVNTARGRVKDRNMRERGAVALAILDPDDPYHRLGPSSTCYPEFDFSAAGDTDAPYAPGNVGMAWEKMRRPIWTIWL